MIHGLHAMFYSTRAAELRAFLRDRPGLQGTCFEAPGDLKIQLCQPRYRK